MEGPDVLRIYSERDNGVFQEDFTDVLDSAYAYVTYWDYFSLYNLNLCIRSSIVVFCIVLSLNGLCIILMRKVHSLLNSEENTHWEDMLLDNNDALLVNFVRLLAQLERSQSKVNLVLMDQEELHVTISTWLNVFTADIVNKLAQLTQSLKDQITKTQP